MIIILCTNVEVSHATLQHENPTAALHGVYLQVQTCTHSRCWTCRWQCRSCSRYYSMCNSNVFTPSLSFPSTCEPFHIAMWHHIANCTCILIFITDFGELLVHTIVVEPAERVVVADITVPGRGSHHHIIGGGVPCEYDIRILSDIAIFENEGQSDIIIMLTCMYTKTRKHLRRL